MTPFRGARAAARSSPASLPAPRLAGKSAPCSIRTRSKRSERAWQPAPHPVAHRVRKRRLHDPARGVGPLRRPVPEARTEPASPGPMRWRRVILTLMRFFNTVVPSSRRPLLHSSAGEVESRRCPHADSPTQALRAAPAPEGRRKPSALLALRDLLNEGGYRDESPI